MQPRNGQVKWRGGNSFSNVLGGGPLVIDFMEVGGPQAPPLQMVKLNEKRKAVTRTFRGPLNFLNVREMFHHGSFPFSARAAPADTRWQGVVSVGYFNFKQEEEGPYGFDSISRSKSNGIQKA